MQSTEKKKARELQPREIADARELFLQYGRAGSTQIVREMHERGWKQFRRHELCGRRKTGPHPAVVGLIEALGWEERAEDSRQKIEVSREETEDAAVGDRWSVVSEEGEASHHPGLEDSATPPQAGGELLEPATFKEWLVRTKPEWCWDWKYQKYIYGALERFEGEDGKRLMVFMPPRHGKSELITVRYAAWVLINRPQTRIIIGSYNQKLANRFSRKIRQIVSECGMQRPDREGGLDSDVEHLALPYGQASAPGALPHGQASAQINTADEWETPEGGGVKAVGAGAGVTGFGADLIIIDDPIRSRADAESKNSRERVWEWFCDDLHTRLEPGGQVILIQTRWHEDDLAGRLIKEQENEGEKWDVIRLPALAEGPSEEEVLAADERGGTRMGEEVAENSEFKIQDSELVRVSSCDFVVSEKEGTTKQHEKARTTPEEQIPHSAFRTTHSSDPLGRKPGEALCRERFDEAALLAKKKNLGAYSFAALYQQRPVPAEGGLFKREWFSRIVDRAPEGLRWYRGYDLAVSTKTSADYTASFRCAFDKKTGDLYIDGGFRKRIEFPDQRRYIVDRIKEERNTEHGIEEALHGQAFVQELRRDVRLAGRAFRGVRVTADKYTRALAWANRAEAGKVVLVRGPWNADFLEEACLFPHAPHDDQIDAVSLAVQMIESRRMGAYGF